MQPSESVKLGLLTASGEAKEVGKFHVVGNVVAMGATTVNVMSAVVRAEHDGVSMTLPGFGRSFSKRCKSGDVMPDRGKR